MLLDFLINNLLNLQVKRFNNNYDKENISHIL